MADIRTPPAPSGSGLPQQHQHPSMVNVGPNNNYQYQPYSKTPTHNRSRSCSRTWCILLIISCLILIAVVVLVPLFMTGTLSFHKKPSKTVAKRSTYDPFYYGNLHPYLYPGERQDMGIETDYDVIVVGAGIAGLTAASALQQEGLNVLILEARVGRLFSIFYQFIP
jgi:hypothetical protein